MTGQEYDNEHDHTLDDDAPPVCDYCGEAPDDDLRAYSREWLYGEPTLCGQCYLEATE